MLKLQFKENPNRGVWLVGENLLIGSDSESDVVLDGLGVQPKHAEIAINGDDLTLKSQTGGSCFVNDLPVDPVYKLKAGDELRIGKDRLLIVDPKQQLDAIDPNETTGRVAQAKNEMAEATGWSLIAEHPKLKGREFPINGNCTVGRSKEVAISIPYKLLSRQHAEFSFDGDELHLQDLGSSNGCFVNGERVIEARLKGGETIAFAKLAFTVVAPVVATTPVPEAEEDVMNKTMIRPAVTMDGDKTVLVGDRPLAQPEAPLPSQAASAVADSEPSSSKLVPALAFVGTLVVVGAILWFVL